VGDSAPRPELVFQIHGQWASFTLDKDEVTIGRDAGNDLVIEHRSVSRRHARLCREADGWRVCDLGSRYGTSVNDLGHAEAPLANGDTIYLHRFPLTFVEHAGTATNGFPVEHGRETRFQPTVDFSTLAAARPEPARLQTLLAVVTRASESILVSQSLEDTFREVLDLVLDHLSAERASVMLWSAAQREFRTRCVRHRGAAGGRDEPIFSRTIAEMVVRDRVAVMTTDAQHDRRFAVGESIVELGIRSAMAAPLWYGTSVEGLLYADSTLRARAFDAFDLDLLSALGNQLAMAIERSRLERFGVEQQVARRRLERYHSPAVVERITQGNTADGLVAEERDVTVLFADVVGFTARCERMEPPAVAALLNRYFSELTAAVFRHEGTVDKFIGDCLMAVFGAPIPSTDHQERAVAAALEMRAALERLNRPEPAEERLEFRVGIHSGRVVAGDIGSLQRTDYTVLGATVNLAARLEAEVSAAGQIVISRATLGGLGHAFEVRPLGPRRPRGVGQDIECYEVLGRRGG
jgi:adenylate cyclase